MTWKWYLTIAAVRQYMELAGLRGELEDDNPDYRAAMDDLGELSLTAQRVEGKETRSGGEVWRGRITLYRRRHGKIVLPGKKHRVECVVMPPIRSEGDLPQLVRITLK